jgi:hypothetical protein
MMSGSGMSFGLVVAQAEAIIPAATRRAASNDFLRFALMERVLGLVIG